MNTIEVRRSVALTTEQIQAEVIDRFAFAANRLYDSGKKIAFF